MDPSRLERYSWNWDGPAGARPKPAGRAARWFRRWLPIRARDQQLFALVVAQVLTEGLSLDHALTLAAEVVSGRRFRRILVEARWQFRAGHPLEESLWRADARLHPALFAAIQFGGDQGNLIEELTIFGRRGRFRYAASFARAVGRSSSAVAFAAALSRLLRDRRLTPALIREAGLLASAENRFFVRVADRISSDVENGTDLVESLRRHRYHFDPLFLAFLEASESRESLRACLDRLGDPEN